MGKNWKRSFTMFNPECYLPTIKYFRMYEKALEDLPDDDLWIWLMYRRGKNQTWIASRLGLTQSAISHRMKKMDTYFKKRISGMPPRRNRSY
jgi:hypothetical protein